MMKNFEKVSFQTKNIINDKSEEINRLKSHLKSCEFEVKFNSDFLNEKKDEIDKLNKNIKMKDNLMAELKSKIKTVEKYQSDWKQKLNGTIEEKKEEIEKLKIKITVMADNVDKLKTSIREKDKTISDLSKMKNDYMDERNELIGKMENEIKNVLEDFKQEKKYNSSILNELECIKNENVELTRKLKECNDEINGLKFTLNESQKDLFHHTNENKNCKNEIEKLNTQVKILNLNLKGEVKKNNDNKTELNTMKKNILCHKTKIEQYKYESEQNEIKINKLNEILTEKTIELEKKNLLITKMSFDAKELSSISDHKSIGLELERINIKTEIAKKDEKIKHMNEEIKLLKKEILQFKEKIDTFKVENKNLKEKIKSSDNEKEILEKKPKPNEELNDKNDTNIGTIDAYNSEIEKSIYEHKISSLEDVLKAKDEEITMLKSSLKNADERSDYNVKLKTDLIALNTEKTTHTLDSHSNLLDSADFLNFQKKSVNDFSLFSCNSAIINDIFNLNTNPIDESNLENHS